MRYRRSLMVPLFPLLALGGCALPPVVMVGSYSADIVSYAATKKTVTDHVYSAVARSDCSFVRILKGRPIYVDAPAQLAAVPEAQAPAPVTREIYVTVGSFLDGANADRALARYTEFHTVSMAVMVNGQQFNRVVAGPLTQDEADALKSQLVTAANTPNRGARG